MKTFAFRSGDDARALWMLTLITIAAGSFAIQRSYETAIFRSGVRGEAAYRQTLENDRIVRLAAELRASESIAAADLHRLSRDTRAAQSTAELLATLQNKGEQAGVSVQGVQPAVSLPDAGPSQPLDSRFAETPMTLRISGTFRALLQFVEYLSEERTLVGVEDVQLSLGDQSRTTTSADPQIDAVVHATLYRLHLPVQEERRVAAAR